MTADEIRAAVLDALAEVAPEADPAGLDPRRPIREQVEIDSMDLLFFLTSVADRTGVEVAEADYGEVHSIDDVVGYVRARLPAPASNTSAVTTGRDSGAGWSSSE